jgi:thymidylate synthase ThyX
MNPTRRIYPLSPSQLSAETIAVTFAKTSRSPEPFDVIAAELDAEKSAKFSEKWIVGYGHSSVAEHAVLHLALENVSRLAIETIESNRLASYTEKSTRYQEWNPEAYVLPPEIAGSPYESRYREVVSKLFETYTEAMQLLRSWSQANTPRQEGESEKAWQNRARTRAVDVCRFLLPAASLANVGVTINARALEYAIRKLLSSELQEVREIGAEVKAVATQEVPTLVKYANPIPSLAFIREQLCQNDKPARFDATQPWCQLLKAEPEGEEQVLAAVLYRFSNQSYAESLNQVRSMSTEEKAALLEEIFAELGPFDVPLRELEYATYDFDLVLDQGAYFELKRHRMMTQTAQRLSTRLGYALPKAISAAGFEGPYRQAMDLAAAAYEELAAWNPAVAAYLVPNAFNRRVLCRLNMRELFHLARLRCSPNAHFSMRRAARAMAESMQSVHPNFWAKMNLSEEETSQSITAEYFTEVAAIPLQYKD